MQLFNIGLECLALLICSVWYIQVDREYRRNK